MLKNLYCVVGVLILFSLLTTKCLAARQNPLICYQCSSATKGAESFCGETFDESSIPWDILRERNIQIERNCNSTIDSEHERPVCRKTVEETLNGNYIIKRYCYYTNKSDSLENCNSTSVEKNVRQIFCQDCDTDRCNSAEKTVNGILLLFVCLIMKLKIM